MGRVAPKAVWPIALRSFALGCALATTASAAHAEPERGAPTEEDRKKAARHFAEAEKAYAAQDWTRAAVDFESAYRAAPHPDPLWNAARAWHRANELARAANLYARYLDVAPTNARDRPQAQRALAQIARSLGRIDVHGGAGIEELRVDGKTFEGESVYVVPGVHAVSGRHGERVIEQTAEVAAGSVRSVSLVASANAAEPAAPLPPPVALLPGVSAPPRRTPPDSPEPFERRGWSPWVVVVGAGLTAAAAGLCVWSGLDTLSAREAYDAFPTQSARNEGSTKELRTNVLLGAAVGAGLLTGATALFLVDWRGGSAHVAIGPASLALRGRF